MSIPIDTYCLQCLLRRNIALAQTLGTEEQAMAFAKEIMKLCINAPEGVSSPWFGPQIADLLHDMYGLDYDRFRQEKLDSNRFVLERLPMIRKRVTESKDPVLAGLQFAILGNYLDFSALQGQVSFEKLEEMLDKALEMELDDQVYAYLCRDLRRGGKLVYLTDNAGEIGFDRVLAEAIAAAEIVELTVDRTVRVDFPYVAMNAIMRVVKEQQPRIEEQTFDNLCTMRLAIRESRAAELIEKLRKAGGSVRDEAE